MGAHGNFSSVSQKRFTLTFTACRLEQLGKAGCFFTIMLIKLMAGFLNNKNCNLPFAFQSLSVSFSKNQKKMRHCKLVNQDKYIILRTFINTI